jgi:hypothetical protein
LDRSLLTARKRKATQIILRKEEESIESCPKKATKGNNNKIKAGRFRHSWIQMLRLMHQESLSVLISSVLASFSGRLFPLVANPGCSSSFIL